MTKKVWVFIPLVLILILTIIYCYQAIQFQDKFVTGTTIGDTDVGKLTKTEAITKLEELSEDDVYHILDNKQQFKDIPKTDFGVEFNVEKTVTDTLNAQNPWLWFMNYVKTPENVPIDVKEADEKAVETSLAAVKKEVEAYNKEQTPSKDATVEFKDGEFQIIPEVQGTTIDVSAFIEAAKKSILKGDSSIELSDFTTKPKILASDDTLKKELDNIKKIADINAGYSINGQEVAIPKETIASWVTTTEGKVDLDQEKVRAYVAKLGETYNTSTNATNFKSTKQGDVSVPAGALSWTIAVDTETAQLTEAILAGEDFSGRVPAYQGSGTPASPLVGNTYIEVDLANQHMWYYKDGAVVLDTPIISGKPSTPTPPGVFYVWKKERNATLKGEDYESPVDYWMPIDWTGVGIHDSPWQPADSYGGDSHLTIGSHGCINTPPSVCKELYNMIDVGIPVVVF